MPQYITSLINNKWILIDAGEIGWIREHGSEDNIWATIEPQPEPKRRLRLVYGAFLLNPAHATSSLNPKSLSVMKGMEMAYINFEPQDHCFYAWRSLRVNDIEMLQHDSKLNRLPFAAIVEMADEVPRSRNFSLSAFPYNSQLSVQQTITTRPGVLAINDEDRRKQRKLRHIDWRVLIDHGRARRAAELAANSRCTPQIQVG